MIETARSDLERLDSSVERLDGPRPAALRQPTPRPRPTRHVPHVRLPRPRHPRGDVGRANPKCRSCCCATSGGRRRQYQTQPSVVVKRGYVNEPPARIELLLRRAPRRHRLRPHKAERRGGLPGAVSGAPRMNLPLPPRSTPPLPNSRSARPLWPPRRRAFALTVFKAQGDGCRVCRCHILHHVCVSASSSWSGAVSESFAPRQDPTALGGSHLLCPSCHDVERRACRRSKALSARFGATLNGPIIGMRACV